MFTTLTTALIALVLFAYARFLVTEFGWLHLLRWVLRLVISTVLALVVLSIINNLTL